MSEAKVYEAIADFSLNLDNGKTNVAVRVGDEVLFDGLNVECRGEKGQARSLSKVVGEWIKPKNGSAAPVANVQTLGPAPGVKRNAMAGRIVEDSDAASDLGLRSQQEDSNSELRRLVHQYENTPAPKRTQDDQEDMRKESRVQVENQDAQEVAKVSDAAKTDTEVKNTAGVEIQKTEKTASTVISHEEKVAKETNYSKKKSASAAPKKLKVDKEAAGVEVRKVKTPVIQKNDVKTGTVVEEQKEVAQMDYPVESTDVGSTTQAQLESSKILKSAKSDTAKVLNDAKAATAEVLKPAAPQQAPAEKSPKVISDRAQDQDGVVVRKVSKVTEDDVTTQEGITSKVTVGSGGDVDPGDVVFESNSEINEGKATFSKVGDTVTDLSGVDDMDIDINGILDNV
jgi:hypothetical protein